MPLSRKKSCVPCRQSKTRCDLAVPLCSRCRLRNHDCLYEGEARVSPLPWPQPQPQAEEPPVAFPEAPPTTMLDAPADLVWFDDAVDLSESMKLFSPQGFSLPGFDGHEASHLMAFTQETMTPEVLTPDSLPTAISVSSANPGQVQRLNTGTPGTLQRRNIAKDRVLISIAVGQLTSYPKMMIQGDTLPPFISPPCFEREDMAPDCAASGYHRCLPEDLAVCTSLVRMYFERTAANTSFVWKSIYAECERLYASHAKLETKRQLSVLQALMVYLLLQAGDVASAEQNGASRLLKMIVEMSIGLSETIVWAGEISRHRPERSDWVYTESLARATILLGSLDLVLEGVRPTNLDGGRTCAGMCAFPLPCHRDLWLARSTREWRVAYDRYLSSRKGTKLLTARELLQYNAMCMLDDTQLSQNLSDDIADIARWAEGLDTLGTLVWMIMPLQR